MPPVCSCRFFQRNAVTDQFNCVLSVSSAQIYQRKEKCLDVCSIQLHWVVVSCNSWIQESSSKLSGSPQLLFWSFLDCIKQNTKQEYISLYIHSFLPLYFALSMSASAAYNGDIELSTDQDYCKWPCDLFSTMLKSRTKRKTKQSEASKCPILF